MRCSPICSIPYVGVLVLLVNNASPPVIHAQSRPDSGAVDEDIEAVLEYAGEEAGSGSEHLARELVDLTNDPLNLNTASIEELVRLPPLTRLLARRIVRFRTAYGAFTGIGELRTVEGFSPQIVAAVRPYVTAGSASSTSPVSDTSTSTSDLRGDEPAMHGQVIQHLGRRLDLGRGYVESADSGTVYEGSPYRMTSRVRLRYRETVRANLTFDKDPAEPFGWYPSEHTYGFDFWSAHLALQPEGSSLQLLVVGDYIPAFGQGLVFGRGGGIGRSPRRPVRSAVTHSTGLKPYRSTAENRFFRGAAAAVRLSGRVHLTAFGSKRALDASLAASREDGLAVTRRIPDGFHRTRTERARKDMLGETVVGGAIEWVRSGSRWGVTGYHTEFSHPFFRGARPYQRYDMQGSTAEMIGLYGEFLAGPSHWFGEIARAPSGAIGSTGGTDVELADGVEAIVLLRHYPRAFTSLYGRGKLQNETGIYSALRLHRLDQWDLSAAFDQFWHPWLRFTINRPTTGYAGTVSLTHRPRSDIEIYLQFRSGGAEQGTFVEDRSAVLRGVAPAVRQTLRLHGTYRRDDTWRLRTRIELSRARTPGSPLYTGSLLYQDLRWSPAASLQFDGRITFFHTENYAARLYAYENDLLYGFSVPALYGRGQRIYLLARWTSRRGLTLQCKYAVSRFLDRTTVGSGWDEVSGNRLRELRMLLRIKW